jgi:hypothetical protein
MYKSTALTEKMAAIENAAEPKIIADGKIIADLPAEPEKQATCLLFRLGGISKW